MALLAAGELSQAILRQLRARGGQPRDGVRGPEHQPVTAQAWPPGSDPGSLARRRSDRRFTGDPVPLADLALIIGRAREAERVLWPTDAHGAIRYTILFAAYRIAGLAPGLYLANEREDDGFCLLLTADDWLGVLRAAYSDAACLVFVCADFTAACCPGSPGYGPLLIRAGTLGHAVWLSAIDVGLAGCVYGAPHHHVTDVLRRTDDWSRHVFTTALGVPAQEDPGQ